MRWSTFTSPTDPAARIGVMADGYLHQSRSHRDLLGLLREGSDAVRSAGEDAMADPAHRWALEDVHLLAPIPVPPSVRDFMAFEDHLLPIMKKRGATLDPAWYEIPAFYFTSPAAIVGPHDDVRAAPGGVELDFELEVAAVIGRDGRNLTPEEGQAAIAGYILMCDWSARDLQKRERPINLGPVKGKDWGTSLGPFFVTADELSIAPGERTPQVRMTAEVNGRPYSDGRLSELYWTFGQMVSYASRGTEVRIGDILGSGTVGTGCIADLSARHSLEEYPWLRPGDQLRLDGGVLGNIECRLVEADPVVPLS